MVHFILCMAPTITVSLLFNTFLVKNFFVFTECDFKYIYKPQQYTHILIHSEEKPFSCTVCDFNPNKQITCIFTHTGEISTYTKKCNSNYATIRIIILIFKRKNDISNG